MYILWQHKDTSCFQTELCGFYFDVNTFDFYYEPIYMMNYNNSRELYSSYMLRIVILDEEKGSYTFIRTFQTLYTETIIKRFFDKVQHS